jgi:hypothetical protein
MVDPISRSSRHSYLFFSRAAPSLILVYQFPDLKQYCGAYLS